MNQLKVAFKVFHLNNFIKSMMSQINVLIVYCDQFDGLLGIWAPRVSEDQGQPLNSPRLISGALFPDNDNPNYDFTLMLMQYGQFLSHDITQSIDTSFGELKIMVLFLLLPLSKNELFLSINVSIFSKIFYYK